MSVKKIIRKLEEFIRKDYSHYDAKFYANRSNTYIHLGLDVSLFSFNDYKFLLNGMINF